MGNQRNCKRKYDRAKDIEAHRDYERNYYKRKKEGRVNIQRKNQSQLEVQACM